MDKRPRKQAKTRRSTSEEVSSIEWDFIKMTEQEEDLICRMYRLVGDSPIYDTNDWAPSGDVYVGGTTGLAIWAVTLAALLAGGALLVYSTSALSQ